MHVLLTIGFERLLLPSEQGLQTVIKALSTAYLIKPGTYHYDKTDFELDGRVEVSVKMLPGMRITTKRKVPSVEILNPEVIPPADVDTPSRRRARAALPGTYPTLNPNRQRMLIQEGGRA